MKKFSLIVAFICLVFHASAQDKTITVAPDKNSSKPNAETYFHPGYLMLGFNLPNGNFKPTPNVSIDAKQNFLLGQMGEKTGYLFQAGRIFYFNSKKERLRYGLDWTVMSFTYNKMDWNSYASINGGSILKASCFIGASTRIGPAISYNAVGKLVVSVHFQVSPTVDITAFEYEKSVNSQTTEQLNLVTGSIFQNTGIKTNFGLNVRWGIVGLAFDYVSGSMNYNYQYMNTQTGEGVTTNGDSPPTLKQKLKTSAYEIKIVL